MKDGTVLDSVKMPACMLETCKIGLQWSINRNVKDSRVEGGVAYKLRD